MSDSAQIERGSSFLSLVVPEHIDLSWNSAVPCSFLNSVQQFVQALGIEEFFELFVEDLELILKIWIIVSISDSLNQLLASF